MKRENFKFYGLIITIIVGIAIGFSVILGESIIAILAVAIGMILLYFFRSRVKQTIEDERIHRISEKASRRTIQFVGTTTGLLGLVIFGFSKSGYLQLTDVGFSLAFFASILLMVYMIFYTYYGRKLGV